MRITEIDCILLTAPYGEPPVACQRSYGVVVVGTDDGRRGYGEPYAAVNMPTVCREIVRLLQPEIVGQDAEPIDPLIDRLHNLCEYFDHRGMASCVVGAIDWALHDLAAQRAQIPLHRMLNRCSADSVALYASTNPTYWSPQRVVDEIHRVRDQGFQTTKLRAGGNSESVTEALHRVNTICEKVGGMIRLGLDVGQQVFWAPNTWSVADVRPLVEGLRDLRLLFLEDPLLIHDYAGYQELVAMNCVPIAGGEMFAEPEPFERYIRGDAIDVVQPDAAVVPGPRAVLRIGRCAAECGKPVVMHGWAGPVAQMQNIHAALAIEACDLVEYCTLKHPLLKEGLQPVWQFDDGRLRAPQSPGLGIHLGTDLLDRYAFMNVSSLIA